jgi:hypothetical protein
MQHVDDAALGTWRRTHGIDAMMGVMASSSTLSNMLLLLLLPLHLLLPTNNGSLDSSQLNQLCAVGVLALLCKVVCRCTYAVHTALSSCCMLPLWQCYATETVLLLLIHCT